MIHLRIAVVGSAGSGKSALIERLVGDDTHTYQYNDSLVKVFQGPRGPCYVHFREFKYENKADYSSIDALLIVADVNDDQDMALALSLAKGWKTCTTKPVSVVANKTDMTNTRRRHQIIQNINVHYLSCKSNFSHAPLKRILKAYNIQAFVESVIYE